MSKDTIYRQAVIDALKKEQAHYAHEDGAEIFYEYNRAIKALENLPSAQQERLTDDDFETIRIHLNAYKEKLCNQRRWEEAEEYQRIIDRFMAFASAQPDLDGTKFDIIFSQRQTGRTTKLIEKCARYKYALIVCPTRMRANIVFKDARKMGKNIPMPITFEEFISGRFSTEHINAFLIDDLDQCLAIYSRHVPIDTVVIEKRMSMREEE